MVLPTPTAVTTNWPSKGAPTPLITTVLLISRLCAVVVVSRATFAVNCLLLMDRV